MLDNTLSSGLSTNRWVATYSTRFITSSQNIAFSATPALDCTAGNFIHLGPVTANITGPTMVAGSAGEKCTIAFLKDATAGAYSISFSGASNVRASGTLIFGAAVSDLVVVVFVWDDRLSTPAWVETSRANVN
ncbi:MAG: hypothetical protein ACREQD_10320 [Candidatus Binataceae bacterium]